jgi:hypothetical protein
MSTVPGQCVGIDPAIGGFYARLVARGKTFKQAMTACMRTPLVLMNTLVARGQVRDPSYGSWPRFHNPAAERSARGPARTPRDCAFCQGGRIHRSENENP